MMPGGGEEKLAHNQQHHAHPNHHHHQGGGGGGSSAAMHRRGIQEPIPRHAKPRHSWPQHSSNISAPSYYHHEGPPPPPPPPPPSYSREMHPSHPMMQHPDAGYHHHPHAQAQMMHSPDGGNYYPPPPPSHPQHHQTNHYYGHPSHGEPPPPPQHHMNHPGNYYSYGGHPPPPPPPQYHQHHHVRPPDHAMEYHHHRGDPGTYGMQYDHPCHPGDPRIQQHHMQGHYQEHYMQPQQSMDPACMYPPHELQRPPSFQHNSSYSVDSRSTLTHNEPAMPRSMNPSSSYPSHIGLRSIADDSTTKTPSPSIIPPPPPPPPPPPSMHEPHEISAPSSLDETELGPLRHSAKPNRNHHRYPRHNTFGGVEGPIPQEMGSSEKKETLDTASVLLAFSSTKKRPASTTSTLDDTDALSLATMSTLPHSIAPPDHGHSVTFCPPTDYPKRLSMPEDKNRLNQLHCFMRSELLEVVVIQPADGTEGTDTFSQTPTSSDPLQIGRVGLRCVHCSMSADGGRTGPSMSIFYPKTTNEIYRLVTSWKRCHLSKCKNIPKSVREELGRLNEVKARGKTSYWSESAAQLGLVNMPTKIGGICFSATAENVGRSDSATPAKFRATMPSEQTTITDDTQSPESLPTISDTSTLPWPRKPCC